jgi:hypothetical protein
MSIKSKVLATAATLALVGGVGTAGVLGTTATANAATPACGPSCLDIFSQEFGQHHSPNFLLDVYQQRSHIGTKIILFRASDSDPAEDFKPEFEGTVADFLAADMVTPAFALHYGCLAGDADDNGAVAGVGNFPDCFGLESMVIHVGDFLPQLTGICETTSPSYQADRDGCVVQAQFNDPAFEIEYAPNGAYSGLCVGVASTAVQEEHVTLQECGASSKTVWAIDLYDNVFDTFTTGYAPLINGSDTNFSQPYVLTYPSSGYPTDSDRPALQTDTLDGYSTGYPPVIATNYPTIDDDQLWGADLGT